MKFAREFQASLEKGEYPQIWLQSAISYKKLKKCIKKVQAELEALGLDRSTLAALWQEDEVARHAQIGGRKGRQLQYTVEDDHLSRFVPKLIIELDPEDGSPMDARLSPETRRYVQTLPVKRKQTLEVPTLAQQFHTIVLKEINDANSSSGNETIEVPLTSDTEFFGILQTELVQLDQLQEIEQARLKSEIVELGHELNDLKASQSKKAKGCVETWREIFRLYTESQIFFSSHEQDAGARDSDRAQKQMELFRTNLMNEKSQQMRLDKSTHLVLERFLRINVELLRFVKFQEVNLKALSKILKKHDKQTALQSQLIKPQWMNTAPFVASNVAKATCFTISDELLQIIPQLDDYLCPVCFSIAYRPVRLRCKHVFCIRCLIVMQRAEQDQCPLCRQGVVMEASSEELDTDMTKFLKKNFPNEVKAKQKANEFAAGVDQFGEGFKGTHRCTIM